MPKLRYGTNRDKIRQAWADRIASLTPLVNNANIRSENLTKIIRTIVFPLVSVKIESVNR